MCYFILPLAEGGISFPLKFKPQLIMFIRKKMLVTISEPGWVISTIIPFNSTDLPSLQKVTICGRTFSFSAVMIASRRNLSPSNL